MISCQTLSVKAWQGIRTRADENNCPQILDERGFLCRRVIICVRAEAKDIENKTCLPQISLFLSFKDERRNRSRKCPFLRQIYKHHSVLSFYGLRSSEPKRRDCPRSFRSHFGRGEL